MSFSTLMAHMELDLPNDDLLSLTAGLADEFEASVIGVGASQPIQVMQGEVYVAADLVQLDRDQIEREAHEAEAQFRTALASAASRLTWRATVTCLPLSDYIADQARAADLIITAPNRGGVPFESSRRTDIGDLVMRAGRPVLIVPARVDRLDLASVLIGWKDTRESRRAVADAMPLLKKAATVGVVEVADKIDIEHAQSHVRDVAAWLSTHGVSAEPLAVQAQGDVTEQLEQIAKDRGVGLVVAGAYGHSRLREWVFGGVTREVLMHPRRCTLVSH
ncbi:MAG TPA: universal stress protein [Caulobacteraceae bacterium]